MTEIFKICTKCHTSKALVNFHKGSKGKYGTQSVCKPCVSKYRKEYYTRNIDKIKQDSHNRRRKRIEIINEYKSKPCADCGNKYHSVAMDFDHLENKEAGISFMVRHGYSMDLILKEISKCEVVCAVCHRIRTHERSGNGLSC